MEPAEEPGASFLRRLASSLQLICSIGRRDLAGRRPPTDPSTAALDNNVGSSPPSEEETPPPSDDEETAVLSSSPSADRPGVEELLPPDYREILLRMVAPVGSASQEEIYRLLCNSVLIDEGKKSFALDASTGRKRFVLSARDLEIVWGGDERYWGWTSLRDSRFLEVAVLFKVWWLEIAGTIHASDLSVGTPYAAYLVFSLCDQSEGLGGSQEAFVRVGGHKSKHTIYLTLTTGNNSVSDVQERLVGLPRRRDDGWMEVELGEFTVHEDNRQEVVHVKLKNVDTNRRKRGLIVEGVEVRPK